MPTDTIDETAERTQEKSQVIVDDQGLERHCYQVGDRQIVFRARDEQPTFNGGDLASLQPVLVTVDEMPHQQDKRAGFREYAQHVAVAEEKHGQVLVANATPVGIIDLAMTLSNDDQAKDKFAHMREKFLSSEIGDEERAFLDKMAASVFIEADKTRTGIDVTDGLMDLVQALNGSAEAQAIIEAKLDVQEQRQEHHVLQAIGEVAVDRMFVPKPVSAESLDLAKPFVLVRTTGNKPDIDIDGTVHMRAAADHSRSLPEDQRGTYDPRGTVHFSVNHFVQSHSKGNFKGREYVVVAPLAGAMEANGVPATMASVDTFFAKSPNESIDLPDAVVIQAGGSQEELVTKEGSIQKFKSEGFKKDQLASIYKEFGDQNRFEINKMFYNLGIMNVGNEYPSFDEDLFIKLLGELPDDEFNTKLAEINQRLLVSKVIEENGAKEAHPDGMSTHTEIDPELSEIAKSLNVNFGLHSSTPYWWLEEKALRNLSGTNRGGEQENLNNQIADLPPSIQRLYLHDGLFSISQKAPDPNAKSYADYI